MIHHEHIMFAKGSIVFQPIFHWMVNNVKMSSFRQKNEIFGMQSSSLSGKQRIFAADNFNKQDFILINDEGESLLFTIGESTVKKFDVTRRRSRQN